MDIKNPSRSFKIGGLFNYEYFEKLKISGEIEHPRSPQELILNYLQTLSTKKDIDLETLNEALKKDIFQMMQSEEYLEFLEIFFEFFSLYRYIGSSDRYIYFFQRYPQFLNYFINDINFVIRLLEQCPDVKIENFSEEIKKNPRLPFALFKRHHENLNWYSRLYHEALVQMLYDHKELIFMAITTLGLSAIGGFITNILVIIFLSGSILAALPLLIHFAVVTFAYFKSKNEYINSPFVEKVYAFQKGKGIEVSESDSSYQDPGTVGIELR